MKENKTEEMAMTESQESKPEKKGKRIALAIINTIINVLIVVVLVISVLVATVALTSKSDPNGLPNIFGYTFEYVQTNSMNAESPDGYEGGNFSDQDVIIGKTYSPDAFPDLNVGDIVTYRSSMRDSDGNVMLITHRIVEKEVVGGETVFRTKGDANDVIDQQSEGQYLVSADIVSVFYTDKYHGKILRNFAGVFRTVRSQQGFFLFILIPMIAFFLYAIIRVIISAMNYKKDKAEEEKQEAVEAAVAEALAEKDAQKPENMTPEQIEQFKKFLAQQEAQKAEESAEDAPAEDESTDSPEEPADE